MATEKKKENAMVDHGDIAGGAVVTAQGAAKMRLPYPKSLEQFANIGQREWQVLIDSTFPSAKTVEAICMAVAYCKERKLDIFKKPVHIVPVWSSAENRMVETVWQGITEIRITAARTGSYAGKDATAFGPTIERKFSHTHQDKKDELDLAFPEWAQVTVYRLVQGVRCPFVGPKVYWLEAYATKDKWSELPNAMWADRKSGQLEKCAEAAALRLAFPEELGNEYTAEEIAGRAIDQITGFTAAAPAPAGDVVVIPPQPKRSDFERGADKVTGEKKDPAKPTAEKPKEAEKAAQAPKDDKPQQDGDPRGEAPAPEGVAEEERQPEQLAQASEDEGEDDEEESGASAAAPRSAFDDWFDDQKKELANYSKVRDLSAFYDGVIKELEGDDDRMREFTKAYEARQDEIKAAKAGKNSKQ